MALEPVQIPQDVRLKLCRAAVQVIARHGGADILHIKGDAVHPSLRTVSASGSDVDILVRPSQVAALHEELLTHGWRVYSSFAYGSPFGHAQTYLHEQWGYLDLHRLFPGIELAPPAAFQLLWSARIPLDIAGVTGSAPSIPAQSLILLLNSARSPHPAEVDRLWNDAASDERAAITEQVERLHADVAFGAATGDLARHRGARSYPLWRVVTEGGTRTQEWAARIRAAGSWRERIGLILRAPAVNVEQLQHRLGRRPTRAEVAMAFVARPALAIRQWRESRRR